MSSSSVETKTYSETPCHTDVSSVKHLTAAEEKGQVVSEPESVEIPQVIKHLRLLIIREASANESVNGTASADENSANSFPREEPEEWPPCLPHKV